jgi:hypothetical protein
MIEETYNKKKSIAIHALKALKESTLFNFSLGSKELFHSNFIAWLAEKYPSEIGKIFSEYINEAKPTDFSISPPLREKENIDLIFTYKEGQMLIIENKVKSLPYIEQLTEYSKKHNSNRSYLLLSLLKPNFVDNNNEFLVNDSVKWKFLSYNELSELLKKINPKESYDKLVINDYISFIKNLSLLESILLIDWNNDLFDFYTGKISDDINFRSLRIHDFLLKHKYGQIKHRIIEEFQNIINDNRDFKIIKNGDWVDGNIGDCYLEQGFTNSQGLVGFKFIIKKIKRKCPLILGLQLQGNSFRLVVECPEGKYALNAARLLKDKEFWFTFNEVKEYQSKIEIKGKGQKNNDKEFASFSGRFFYKYVNIDNIKMIDLVMLISHYYLHIKNNFQEISNIINITR